MSKEYNLAGKNLVVDGLTILGTRKSSKGMAMTNAINSGTARKETQEAITIIGQDVGDLADRMGDAEDDIDALEDDTKRFELVSKQTSIVRDDASSNFQIIVLESVIVGYPDSHPVLAIQTNETYYRICAMEENPSQATIEALNYALEHQGTTINPTPSGEGSWYRGGLLFQVGSKAMYVLHTEDGYISAELTITAVSDTNITGTVSRIYNGVAKGIDDRNMTGVALYIPYRRAGQVKAYLYDNQTLKDHLTIPVTNITRRWKEIGPVENISVLNEMTGDSDGLFIDGDCCVVKYEYNEDTQQYDNYQLNTYIYKNDQWVRALEDDAAQLIQTIYTYMEQASAYKQNHPEFNYEDTYTGQTGVFGVLMAGILYAGSIFANEIKSSEYEKMAGAEFPTKGFRLSTRENLIEAVNAAFHSARIKNSSLEDVTISITDDATSSVLLKSTAGVTPPQSSIEMPSNHETGYYVESSMSAYKWDSSLLARNAPTNRSVSGYDSLILEFTARGKCKMQFDSQWWFISKLGGSFGSITMDITVNGTSKYHDTKNENVHQKTTIELNNGDEVVFSITYVEGDAWGIEWDYDYPKIKITEYYDQRTGNWITVSSGSLPYSITQTADRKINNTWDTITLNFPVMEYAAEYEASTLDPLHFLVNDTTASSQASLVQTAYNAIYPLLTATGTRGSDQVQAIPRNVWIDLSSCTLRYKGFNYNSANIPPNQLYLADSYAIFARNGVQYCTITDEERATLFYSVGLAAISPSLSVGDLLPGTDLAHGGTKIGSASDPFDEEHVETIYAGSITKPSRLGATLTIDADQFIGPVSGDLTGDVTAGNVNSRNNRNTYDVWGAVFN